MYYREVAKSKTAAKTITYNHQKLKDIVLKTLAKASAMVGSTLGPNGKVVLIERQENLGPYLSKDGITVFNSMAFADPTAQVVLEAARDSSSKTNVEAGDGTTTATILADSLIRNGFEYLEKNPRLSSQKIMRELEKSFENFIVPFIRSNAVRITNENKDDLMRKVALISTNNDVEMTDAVMECFGLVGTNGQVTIAESSGMGGFGVEKVDGFPIARGFEDSCGRFLEEFINDRSNYRTMLDKPKFILYNGKITDINSLLPLFDKIGNASDAQQHDKDAMSPNIVLIAHAFSESVVATLASNFKAPNTINVIPVITPMTHQANSPYHFLLDVSSFTGASVFDPLSKPLPGAEIKDLGIDSMKTFEYSRYKSLIIGTPDEGLLIPRVEELEQQAKQAESVYDAEMMKERMSILTGGIARLKVYGSSEAELKEKRHRVEDAVCAIKGAIKDGVLPGCAKTLNTLASQIHNNPALSDAVKYIMGKSLVEPFRRILTNGGQNIGEVLEIWQNMMFNRRSWLDRLLKKEQTSTALFYTYDALNHKFGDAIEIGVIDSASAVLYAIKNSLSVAKMLMGLSGIVVFQRDSTLDSEEAADYHSTQRTLSQADREQEWDKWEPRF
jgi:chaperonin GroEL